MRHEMVLELVCGADLWCEFMCGADPGDLGCLRVGLGRKLRARPKIA